MAATTERPIDAAEHAHRARGAARQARSHSDAAESELATFVTGANVRPNALLAALFPRSAPRARRSPAGGRARHA